ncbi:CDP-glycerol glycerophosphotransferase family protein [Salirhabdus salicampi]|uniref:CDP-glycerol glycerophosphotransferase family protein n=1 Tax=Salirhabdus salicampi TaxID=476102 RepID=UPI0020C4BE44|nr:CDP-glycerol glycerophosphotransferase family protein [Salirhabdus salicampi]MCP8617482.1 CDP-glycerol glycerophosphotransferase family protein [Salirhabdus salicampi]
MRNFFRTIRGLQKPETKNKKKLKQTLTVTQKGENINIEGKLNKDQSYIVKQLILKPREGGDFITFIPDVVGHEFRFQLSFNEISHLSDEHIYDLYILVNVPSERLSKKKIKQLEGKAAKIERSDGNFDLEYPMRLGKFEHTICHSLEPITINNNRYFFYITKKGNISFSVNRSIVPNVRVDLQTFTAEKRRMLLSGRLFIERDKLQQVHLLLKGRNTNHIIKRTFTVDPIKEEEQLFHGFVPYQFQYELDFERIFKVHSINQDIYDLFLEVDTKHDLEPTLVRVAGTNHTKSFADKSNSVVYGDNVFVIMPYLTIKKQNLSFEVTRFDKGAYSYLKRLLPWVWLLRPLMRHKNIWIVGEWPYKAQDTGYHFYKYMRENHPKRNVYYVIERESPERKNLLPYGNILHFNSKKHIWNLLMARKVICSHHHHLMYPIRTGEFHKKVKGDKVFLQHGVMGTKNMAGVYGKGALGFEADLFFVSSEFEKDMIVEDFGYERDQVKVTGLSRFDQLFEKDVDVKRQLLIIPTWRDWLLYDSTFLESEYFQRYKRLINHPYLYELSQTYNFEIVFCLHPNMRKYVSYFKDFPIKVIHQGEVDVQHLLKESSMMITDYSSVGFDFSFLHRPVVYYQFDREKFLGEKPSHLDLDQDLPGDIVFDEQDVLECVENAAKQNFQMKNEYKKRAEKFLKYRDQKSSERIFHEIQSMRKRPSFVKTVLKSKYYDAFYKRFRKSKYYKPVMHTVFNVLKTITPVDSKLIVFESNIGKHYGDSPKYIYEEMVKRNLDYKIVWVCNKKVRFHDPNTKRIKRLSPSYFYYLARAKYWVNNQNFPTYLKRRRGTTYLQTWHGTPLKKMLFDMKNVKGRSEGYIERVYNATKTWDYLISPSPYASSAFKSAFKYEGHILELGYPRNDIFYLDDEKQQDIADKVKQTLNIPKDKKVILYAPTFRDHETTGANKFTFQLQLDLDAMQERLGDEYVLLLRMHIAISQKLRIPAEHQQFVKNVSNYPDIQELFLLSDILITDYSSVMFDFANSMRPILFFTYDFEMYRDDIRGFYMDFEQEAPGPLLKTTEELIHSITNIEDVAKQYEQKYKAFHETYCLLEDGKASERVVDQVLEEK